VAGRTTTAVAIRRADGSSGREQLYFDRASGLLLRRDQWDDGRLARRVAFVRITDPVPAAVDNRDASRLGAHTDDRPPWPTGDAPDDVSAAPRLGDGFELLGTYGRPDGNTQLYYSDGLFGLSLFAAPGELAWDELPEGGQVVEVGDIDARVYRTPAGSAVLWDDEDVAYTCVSDAPLHEVEAIISDLERRGEPSTLDDIGRFVTGPFSWG
jgi:sigma-E factor negative regulatory protein RseB